MQTSKISLLYLLTLTLFSCVIGGLLNCNDRKLIDVRINGPKADNEDISSGDNQFGDILKEIGCRIQEGAIKVAAQAKKINSELKENAKRWSEKAKDFGANLKAKFNDFKEKLSKDSFDERNKYALIQNVEIIDPDILKGEQQCGHGYILDALGNCSKLRK